MSRRRFLGVVGAGSVSGGIGGRRRVRPDRPARAAAEPVNRPRPAGDPGGARFGIRDVNDLVGPRPLHRVALSPDGRLLVSAVVRSGDYYFLAGLGQPEFDTGAPGLWATGVRLWLTDVEAGTSWPLTGPEGRAWSPRWSPDGALLAFLADHTGAVNVWVWERNRRGRRRRPRPMSPAVVYPGILGVDTPQWSPDGSQVYVPLRPESDRRAPGRRDGDGLRSPAVDVLVPPPTPPGGPTPGQALFRGPSWFRDLGVVDTATGRVRRLLEDFPAYQYVVAPDGRRLLIVTIDVQPDVRRSEFRHDLFVVSASGGTPSLVASGVPSSGSIPFDPAWSPNSGRVAFVREGAAVVADVDSGETGEIRVAAPLSRPLLWHPDGRRLLAGDAEGRLWRLEPGTGRPPAPLQAPRNMRVGTYQLPVLVHRQGGHTFAPGPGDACYAAASTPEDDGSRWSLALVPLDGGPATVLVEDAGAVDVDTLGDVSADGSTVVFGSQDDRRPTELSAWAGPGTEPRRITRFNPDLERFAFGHTRRVPFTSKTGERLASLLLLPSTGNGPFPTVVNLYPSARPSRGVGIWDRLDWGIVHAQVLASRGVAVLFPDHPIDRGNTLTNTGELLAIVDPAVDEAARLGYTDPTRLAVMGQSNGGYGVNLLVTATSRFRAAIAADGMSDLVSFFGTMEITPDGVPVVPWSGQLGPAPPPWAGPGLAADSPLAHLDRITTPLLLIHGTEDTTVPFSQSGELYAWLSYLGKDCTLLAYRGESHVPSRFREANRVHMTEAVLGWLDRYLGKPSGRRAATSSSAS